MYDLYHTVALLSIHFLNFLHISVEKLFYDLRFALSLLSSTLNMIEGHRTYLSIVNGFKKLLLFTLKYFSFYFCHLFI